MSEETLNDLKKGLNALKNRRIMKEEASRLISRYQIYTQMNNNEIDYHVFDEWLEELLHIAYRCGEADKEI